MDVAFPVPLTKDIDWSTIIVKVAEEDEDEQKPDEAVAFAAPSDLPNAVVSCCMLVPGTVA